MGNRITLRGKGGGGTSFTPGMIGGLELWLDADDNSTLYQDAGGTIAAVSDGDPVGRWEDKSGNGNHATQGTGSRRGTKKVGVQNSRDGVRFDGVDDVLEIVGGVSIYPATIFVVMREEVAVENAGVVSLYPATGNDWNTFPSLLIVTGSITQIVGLYSPRDPVGADFIVKLGTGATPAGVYTGRITLTDMKMWHDGVLEGTHSRSAAIASSAGGYLGARRLVGALSGPYLNGDIYEIILYNTALTDENRESVENYLKTKWGTP